MITLQPLTLQITGPQPRLRAQLQAAWPRKVHSARRSRAINSITKHIKDALPGDYKGDVSVFLSNEVEEAHIPSQGFIYHLNQQNILTRQTIHEADNAALLYIHYETALAMDELDDDCEETVPQSRIEQIKQWQKETVKAVFQCMADTALSMAAQTALRGTMAGLNKLGALLAKASSAATKGNPVAKQTTQKAVTRDIASTLSDLRSNLNVASTNSVKPPTKAQLAIRQQLNKLNKITPPLQKAVTKVAQPVKAAPNLKTAPLLKTVLKTASTTKTVPIQKTQIKTAAAPIKAALFATLAKPEVKLNRDIKIAPRVSIIPARVITRIAERTAVPSVAVTPTRFTSHITKVITQKTTQQQTTQPGIVVPARITTQIARPTARFQINRTVIPTLRITPTVIAIYIAANPIGITVPPARTTQKTAQPEKATQPAAQETAILKTTAPKTIAAKATNPTTTAPLQGRPQAQLQRIARQPAQYSAIATSIPTHRNPPRSFSHIALVPSTISRVHIQPRFDTSSIAAPVSTPQQTYTTAPSTPVAPPPSFSAPTIEQPRSEPSHIAAQPPAQPPVQQTALPTETKPTEVAAAPPTPITTTAPPDKRGDVTSPEHKQEPKLLDTQGTAPEPTKPVVKPVAPQKVDGTQKEPLTSPTNNPIPPVVRVGQQEQQKPAIEDQPTGGALPLNNPKNGNPTTQDNKPPIAPPVPNEPPTPLPLPLPIQPPKPDRIIAEPQEPSNVLPFQPANPDKVGRAEPEPFKEKQNAEVVSLEEKRLEKSKSLPRSRVAERVEDPHGLIIKVSGGTGTYKEFVGYIEYNHIPLLAQPEGKPPSSPPERPKAQKSGQSKLGKVLEGPCG